MKLLMVTHYFDSHPGGIEFVAREIFHRLARQECEVTWAAANASPPPEAPAHGSSLPLSTWNGVEKAIGLPFPVPGPVSLTKLWSAVGGNDVLLLHDCLYLSNIAAFIFARVRRIPIIVVQHIGMVPYSNFIVGALMKLANVMVTRPMLRSANQVVFISQITQRYFKDLRFTRPPVLVFNGVDTETFSPPADDLSKIALREHLGLPPEKSVALFVGRFVEKKGIQILEKMARHAPEIIWTFAGSGPLDPREWELANVRVYSDLRRASLADLYRASDVFVLPSTGEGFPLVIQEALACGLPIVCSAETASADDALATFVRAVPLVPGNDEQSAEDLLVATRGVLDGTPPKNIAVQRFRFAQGRYSWSRAADCYFEIALELSAGTNGFRQKSNGRGGGFPSSSTEAEKFRR